MTPRRLAPTLQRLPPILHTHSTNTMPNCSKAPRGLSVLLRVIGIFTDTAISPRPSLRQCPDRYAIRAGRNLPDKEFRYLRTVIVTAAIHQGFGHPLAGTPLTFWHWAGVSPYTSTYVLAETCVFGKQSPGLFRCGWSFRRTTTRPYPEVTAAVLPSSLGKVLSIILVYSTRLPVSVWGTDAYTPSYEDFPVGSTRANRLTSEEVSFSFGSR